MASHHVDCAIDKTLQANAPAQAETLLHSLERAAVGIGLHVNAHKTKYTSSNERVDISTLNSSSLKLVDKFTFPAKGWTAIHRLSDIWKSELTDKIKRSFFQDSVL